MLQDVYVWVHQFTIHHDGIFVGNTNVGHTQECDYIQVWTGISTDELIRLTKEKGRTVTLCSIRAVYDRDMIK